MEHWKKSRNYRSFRRENGDTTFLISIDGRDYPVTADVYKAYSQADRRERYLIEVESKETILSIEKMAEDNVPLDKYAIEKVDSPEAILLNREANAEHSAMLKAIGATLLLLTPDEKKLIQALYFRGISLRQVARLKGITLQAVRKQRDRLLKKLKFLYENIPK